MGTTELNKEYTEKDLVDLLDFVYSAGKPMTSTRQIIKIWKMKKENENTQSDNTI